MAITRRQFMAASVATAAVASTSAVGAHMHPGTGQLVHNVYFGLRIQTLKKIATC